MKKVFFLSGVLVAAFSSFASAQVITVGELDLDNSFTSSTGTAGTVSILGDGVIDDNFESFSYEVTNLDIAGDGTANDVVTFFFAAQAPFGNPDPTIAALDGSPFSFGVDAVGDPGDSEIDPGETLAFAGFRTEVDLGDANEGDLTTSDSGFTGFLTRFPGGGDVIQVTTLRGADIALSSDSEIDGGAEDLYLFDAPIGSFRVNSTDGNGYGVDNISATATFTFAAAVPEPSSATLLFVGGVGFLIRRRR